MYVRYFSEGEFKGLRSIGVSYSTDYQSWSEPVPLTYPGSPPQQMYTNQIAPYYRAPHILLGFPTRYVARPLNDHGRQLDPVPLRERLTKAEQRIGTDLTDGLFMASRDGQSFRRWEERRPKRASADEMGVWRRNVYAGIRRQFEEGLGLSWHAVTGRPHVLDLEAGGGLLQRRNTIGRTRFSYMRPSAAGERCAACHSCHFAIAARACGSLGHSGVAP